MLGLSLRVNRAAAKAGLEPGDLRRVLRVSLSATGALDVERFLSASESIGLTTSAALIVLRELSGSPSFSLATSGTLDSLAFDPVSLFASGEEGALFLPGPTTSFLSTTDLTPAGAGDTVGFQMDTSQGAGYSGGFTGLGSELVTNGTFDTDTNWTKGANWTISGGVATTTAANSSGRAITQSGILTAGKTYYVSFTITAGDPRTGLTAVRLDDGGINLHFLDGSSTYPIQVDAVYTATSADFGLSTSAGSGGAESFSIDNISVRELPGRMQTQITTAARPTLQDSPDQIDFDGVDDFHRVVLPAMSNATVAYASPGVGAVILTGQTITAGNYDWDTDHAGLIILDRPLTASETTGLTAFLNARAGV
jgi:hypothetical protein